MTKQVALVTGATRGIGRVAALELARRGFAVVVTGRTLREGQGNAGSAEKPEPVPGSIESVVAEIEKAGGAALGVRLDLTDRNSIDAAIEAVMARFGRLDVLFNNAGVGAPAVPLEDLPFDKWKAAVDTNVTGTFLCIQEAFRIMKDQSPHGGRIINNGSLAAHTPRPMTIAYTTTKHAITGLTKSAALDGRPFDIACGQIDIGNAASPLTERMVVGDGILQPNGSKMIEPRMEAEDVGNAVLYMANLPLTANVLFMTVMATKMPYVGRG